LIGSERITHVLNTLAATPSRFAAALARLEDADSVMSEAEGEWSPVEVLAHVRASSDILEPRIYQILVRDNPHLVAFDEAKWREVAGYARVPLVESLELMRLRRRELVAALRAISPADWERTGEHEAHGTMSVIDIAAHVAEHEVEHLGQIERAVGAGGAR
jgi:hypothetical protein